MENKAVYYANSLKSQAFLVTETVLNELIYSKTKLKMEVLEANIIRSLQFIKIIFFNNFRCIKEIDSYN